MSLGFEKLSLEPVALHARVQALLATGGRMQMAYAWHAQTDRIEVRYLAAPAPSQPFQVWCCRPDEHTLPSLTTCAPLLGWYEREIHDLYGVCFTDHPQPYPLIADGWMDTTPLIHASGWQRQLHAPHHVPDVHGDDVQLLSFGPVRAGAVESAQFLFHYLGESILHYQPRLFFKHRGMERAFEGRDPLTATTIAERVSGVGSVAHALAYCQAIEDAAGCDVPQRAQQWRAVLAELERLYNHLYYFGHLADTTTLKVGHAEGALLSERAKQLNAHMTGSRFLRNVLTPGGLRRDITMTHDCLNTLYVLRKQVDSYLVELERTTSYLDRLITTGVLTRQVAFDQGATGPVERASGLDRDLRRDHPYAAYRWLKVSVPLADEGDAYARAKVRAAELRASFDLLDTLIPSLTAGPVRAECPLQPGSEGLGWAESPRGSLFYAVHINGDGKLARVKIKSPSFSNWRAFPFTVHRTNMMDYAINQASFGLTIAGCDR
ncbi:hydrogenase large subunit [Dyella mobilis]|uniref:Nickel-dependent hydrogenase large subunit n=1 Tax=Dyella mobilis TaxID=1849582 RepID=A0ABS2KCC0_9GAMM|nr:nickel-dependent hydrogenase large subunit [Dyella mobilis]MBM7128690.1 nickel-dependent hydrogenase large subunit [Dyella mobilis]GLQ99015.1 formate hydrogenlyase [Dyella mobilis]